tara:strand:- start:147 stop:1607 length:1461 start_codon:yes stop_codon:yes gene_type:complete
MKEDNFSHDRLSQSINHVYNEEVILNLNILQKKKIESEEIKRLMEDELVLNSLEKMIFTSLNWENLLKKIREELCYILVNKIRSLNDIESKFLTSLAYQCFINEYVFNLTNKEVIYIEKIITKIEEDKTNKDLITILACYYPLYQIVERIPSLKSLNSSNIKLRNLLKLQVSDPLIERELLKKIKRIGPINDIISQSVMSQYEKRPFPSWRNTFDHYNHQQPAKIIINSEIEPNLIDSNFKSKELKILIAGCGTGRQVVNATRYCNSKITGIELSASSLSYAQRKINELGIDNIELIQMDILELTLLKEKFDIIECSGVLHHMKAPNEGLKSLLQALNSNGFLKLGLYSKQARKIIQKARDHIKERQIEVNAKNLRDFRMSIFNGDLPDLQELATERLFFTISGVEDLCFHTQEYQFTLEEIQKMIGSYNLKFHGFIQLPQSTRSLYKKYFPEDKMQTNLQNWQKFEETHPKTFSGMYQFWISKCK